MNPVVRTNEWTIWRQPRADNAPLPERAGYREPNADLVRITPMLAAA